jgi:hypothetical protein
MRPKRRWRALDRRNRLVDLMDLEQLEALALADDRDAALTGLSPGTVEHDYWRGIALQHRGRLDEVDAILDGWQRRHGRRDESHGRLARRQLLLRAGADLHTHADKLRFEAGIRLDDQAEAVAAAWHHPTRLDPALLAEAALLRDALGRSADLSQVADWALADLARGELDATRRRHLLQRLTRANIPGLVALIAADLAEKPPRAFGGLPVHALLTRAQLDELARLRPELRNSAVWVAAALTRLRPPAHVDWQTDLAARGAYLAALWRFVDGLGASFNPLKAQVLHHQLELDLRLGHHDRDRLLRFLALPRQVHYTRPERLQGVPSEQLVASGVDAAQAAGLTPVPVDDQLVREHLEHFLAEDEGEAFAELLRDDWLAEQLATTRLLMGAPDAERWAAVLGPTKLAALRERVDLELTARNPARVPADAPVVLEVDLKNVAQLVVKTFRIDPVAYFLARGAEVDTAIDLDGMVASDEQILRSEAPAIRRERRRIELPGCARPGTYVIELIGNGKSSRALLRKGGLRHSVRVGAAGPTVRVLDEAGAPLPGARVWLGGREYAPREDGAISIPFSTAPTRASMLLVHGEVAQLETLEHPAERYQFSAGLHLERESMIPGMTARLLLRPQLTLAGWPAPIALVDDPRIELTVTERGGTTSTKSQSVVLRDDAETVVELRIPEEAAAIAVAVRGTVRVASTQQTLDLVDEAHGVLGAIHRVSDTEALHLATTAEGHVLQLLGKTGEPRGGRAIALSFKHVAVNFEIALTLETDEHGRIELGALPGIQRLMAGLPSTQQSWWLWPEHEAPRALHVVAGAPIALPRPPGVPAEDPAAALALLELRGGAVSRDLGPLLRVLPHTLEIAGSLEPGDYLLRCRGVADVSIVVVPAAAAVADGWAAAGPRALELSPPAPLLTELVADADALRLRLADCGPATRVHLIATRFRPDQALPRTLRRSPRPPLAGVVAPVLSRYVSGRDIGDEYRYVLDRRARPRRPGVLLDKPGLLLNPWALRTTSTGVQHARGGGAYGASGARSSVAPSPAVGRPQAQASGEQAAYAALDFMPAAAPVLANLRPDARGELEIRRADLGAAQHVRVIVVDPARTSVVDLPLPATPLRPRDLRLRLALDPAGHFSEERRVEGASAGSTLVIDDVRSGKLELVDTTARAHQVLLALGAPDPLREFGFVTQWHTLDDATRRARYGKYACHELHLFLYFRDPAFFAAVVRPYLANKRHRTFVDRWLLAEDLAEFREPWAFARLNALERVLLARRIPALAPAIARLLGDIVDLIPPDPERESRLVDTLLGAAALEGPGMAESAAAAMDEIDALEAMPVKEAAKKMAAPARSRRRAESDAELAEPEPAMPASAPSPGAPPPPASRGRGDLDMAGVAADLRERSQAAPLYRGADKTQEWAESDWWHVRVADAGPALIPANRFWRDFAGHDPAAGPFLSPHIGECSGSFAAALCALAVLDLPFVAGAHAVVVEEARLALTCASPSLAARTRIVALDGSDLRSTILVGQSYFRADDRWAWDGAEQREKYVEGELLTAVVYQCQVVVTNPTSRAHKLAVLLQIPRGALPVADGFYTRTVHVHLGAYGTQAIEYAFYFPAAGQWGHFPAHVSRAGELLAFAAGRVLEVVVTPSQVDGGSWAHVSQHGTTDELLAFLAGANLGRIALEKIAWRMKDRDAFTRVLALLDERHAYSDRLWAYGLLHADARRVAQWLRHQDAFVRLAGPSLAGAVIDLDPIARGWYEHLEYAPLINARAHQLGARRTILNDALAAQYRGFLEVVAHRASPSADDLLAAAHYLISLDRIDDALAALARVDAARVASPLQYAYLAAYAACCQGDLAAARRLAEPWISQPVERWRGRFAALLAMLDEAQGGGETGAIDPDSREQRMNDLAARQPALEISALPGKVALQHHNLTGCQLRFYRMDIELLFSRQPFVQGDVERFSWIEPGVVESVALAGDGRSEVAIPPALRGANLVIEAVAPGLRRALTHYAHDLATQLAHQYGQVRVLRASDQRPLPATYVKVYARQAGGGVRFYKDGYTDLRGRFDYATLSTDDLDRVERFAILIVSDEAGATVLEAPPPPR